MISELRALRSYHHDSDHFALNAPTVFEVRRGKERREYRKGMRDSLLELARQTTDLAARRKRKHLGVCIPYGERRDTGLLQDCSS